MATATATATAAVATPENEESKGFKLTGQPRVGDISGYKSFTEAEATVFRQWRQRLQGVFERAGFSGVENRPVELADNMVAKGGLGKEIYGMCRVENGQQVKTALPFDRTVPFALWIAQHKANIAFPYKRWDIDYSHRGEHAVMAANRFRGFVQADVDIADYNMGSRIQADAECIATTVRALESLKVPPFVMNINHIRIARAIIMEAGIPAEKVQFVLGQLDKLDKKDKEDVIDLIQEQVTELDAEKIGALIDRFDFHGNINDFKPDDHWGDEARGALEELKSLFDMSIALGVKPEQLTFNLRMVRGLDYYTGVVAETFFTDKELRSYGSIASGGRYDGLVDVFTRSNTDIQGVGFSIGVTRLFNVLLSEKRIDLSRRGTADVLVGFRTQDELLKAMEIAAALREQGLNVDLYSGDKKLRGQYQYASKKGTPYTVMVMNPKDSFVVKDMNNPDDAKGKDLSSKDDAVAHLLKLREATIGGEDKGGADANDKAEA